MIMVWSEMFGKATSYGLSLDNAIADGMFLAGMQLSFLASEFVKKFGEGARAILLRGATATGKYVGKKLTHDFGIGKKLIDCGSLQDLVMDSTLMPHTIEQKDDGAVKISVYDCPFAPATIMFNDPMGCEVCVGYTRGAVDYVTEGKAGLSRPTHICSGDEKCDFYIKEDVPHGFQHYNLKAQLPPGEYLSTLLSKDVNFVKESYLPKAITNPKIVDKKASEEEKKEQALSYLMEIQSLVLRGLVMSESYNAYSLLGKGITYNASATLGKTAADLMIAGFPPLMTGWKQRFGLNGGVERAEKVAVLYSTVMKLDGKIGDGWFEVNNCLWRNMVEEMLKTPTAYDMAKLNKSETAEAIKCGCISCDNCLRGLVGSDGIQVKQTSCLVDGAKKCQWIFE
jgi:predicted hydrocarbon binding protein